MTASISVALCTYDSARFIEQQISSILGQTLRPTEIVVGDDGSTDATLEIIRDLVARDAEADPEHAIALTMLPAGERLGVTANFARTVAACSGELIALCDHDDVWHPDRLEAAAAAFEADPALLFQHADARLVDADGRPLGVDLLEGLSVSAAERAAIAGGRAFAAFVRRNLATGATVLFRRSLLEAALPFPPEWVHDEWLAIVAAATGRVHLLERPVIDYRQHGANQIGVTAPTLRYRIGRMLEPRGDRYVELAARARALVARLESLSTPRSQSAPGSASPTASVPDAALQLARDKAAFEAARADYPRSRLRRLPRVLGRWRAGSYARLSSQGVLDVARDLLQPA